MPKAVQIMRISNFIIALTISLFCASGAWAQTLSDTIDVTHYNIHLDVLNLPAKVLSGKTDVTFVTKQPIIDALSLELKQLQVDSVKSAGGNHLLFARNGNLLRILLPEPVTPTDTSTVTVWYHGVPFAESWGGFHFAGTYAFNLGVGFQSIPHNLGKAWFPCVDDFVDRAIYEYHVRVENTNRAVCGGLLQTITDNGDGTRTFYWKSMRTLPTYLASVAVGPYALVTDQFNGMEAQIPITYYVRPADTNKVAGTFANLKTIATIYENKFGPYPFTRIGITGTGLGAMEHAENIFMPNSTITGNLSNEWLYAHELSHMWFGDAVTCASDADMWMNEGWARWCEILFTEVLYGQEDADAYLKMLHRDVLQYTHIRDAGYRALSPMAPEYTYGSTVYDKGAIVAHALRHYMGDSLFFPAVRYYLSTYMFSDASSTQLRDALSLSSGVDLTAFFDFHVFTPGFTHYAVDSFRVASRSPGSMYGAKDIATGLPKKIHQSDQFEVEVYLKQRLKGTQTYASDCRVDLSFMNEAREIITRQVSFSGVTDSVTVTLPFEPVLVMADLYSRASDATTDEAKTLKITGLVDYLYTFCKVDVKQVSDSAYVRVTHNWVAPDSLAVPQPGLTLSTSRYWTVEGIFPEGFVATGVFNYNKNILDGDIITGANDSIVILYRPGAGHDWQPRDFYKIGPWQLGSIYVDNLRPGEYTLAIWDEAFVGVNNLPSGTAPLHIFPNPANDTFTIQTNVNVPTRLVINNAGGRQVYTCTLTPGEQLKWGGQPGTYIVSLYNENKKIATQKAILVGSRE